MTDNLRADCLVSYRLIIPIVGFLAHFFFSLETLSRRNFVVIIISRLRLPLPHCEWNSWIIIPISWVFSSTLLLMLHWPSVLSNIRRSDTLCPLAFEDLSCCQCFMAPEGTSRTRSVGLPQVRRVASPYTVQLHFGLVLRILGLALLGLLALLPAAI